MANVSSHKNNETSKNTSSGHGALGMGGQPDDDPRDLARGGDGRSYSDQGGRTGPVAGASGNPAGAPVAHGSAGNETVGPMGDKDATADVDNAIRKSRESDKA